MLYLNSEVNQILQHLNIDTRKPFVKNYIFNKSPHGNVQHASSR